MKKRILIVEDDPAISELLRYNLEQNNFHALTAFDGQEAMELLKSVSFSLVLLDLMLPKISGLEIIKRLRADKNKVPIIILTAKDSQEDKVTGLNLGADDYVTKPFEITELIARVNAVLRRQGAEANHINTNAPLQIDNNNFQAVVAGKHILLTKTEYKLFKYLYDNVNITLTREQIAQHLGDISTFSLQSSRAIDIQISHLRDKIEQNPKEPKYLQTVRGFGYRLTM
ncbi:response regulator transcription factor [Lactobacillus sp. ESL0791]|uniref:response regulator transcription factor n=1 Tax=Lactobacillus sp. ESL0791 TaxID=2983234 RepID=UPI0023F6E069|nr:response regulator transcription factor [Lactobacillus sp. ESL0791]MDF7638374.1 response regulator transcription factor [Lactobacillus sp. ESL0791]